MDKKRRDFLKIAGVSTIAGLGGTAVIDRLVSGTNPAQSEAAKEITDGKTAAAKGHHSDHTEAKSGNRFGMVIDLREFRKNPGLGDKIVEACHRTHNVPDFGNKKDEIKWVWMAEYENAFPEHSQYHKDSTTLNNQVPVMCNHCDEPPCVRACPTRATFKNKDGIVAMDYHRCFGCRFCMAACPYGMRSFNWRDPRSALNPKKMNPEFPARMRGVVEKCNFCVERVGIGEQPACVQTCRDNNSSNAMVFGNLNDLKSEIRKVLKDNFTIQRKPA